MGGPTATSPLWLIFAVVILAWGVQLAVRGIARTRASGMGRRAAIYGRLIPGVATTFLFGSSLVVLSVALGVRAIAIFLGTILLLLTMWGIPSLVGGWLRLNDLKLEGDVDDGADWDGGAGDRF
jgi:hypothetical protein